jgi:deazaflavin-dependent oxidoreductase (nitroreductase family)
MPIPKAIARFNRFFTNPLGSLVAGWAPGFAILRHHGRRSGKVYSTPLNIFPIGSDFMVALTYGSDVDWLKNVFAEGRCAIRYRSQEIELVRPETVSRAEGMAAMPAVVRAILNTIGVTEFLRLHRSQSS